MQNDLTKTMPVLICAETCQKHMFLIKYIIGVALGFVRVRLPLSLSLSLLVKDRKKTDAAVEGKPRPYPVGGPASRGGRGGDPPSW